MRRWLVPAIAAACLAGCASPDPALYTIAAVQGPAQNSADRAGAPKVVLLRQIAPGALPGPPADRPLVGELPARGAVEHWWGEPLGAMLSRVLVEEFGHRLPGSAVYAESGAVSVSPDASVELNIQRLDADAAGNVVLTAQAAVVFRAPTQRAGHAELPPRRAAAEHGCARARSPRSAPPSASSRTGWRRCCGDSTGPCGARGERRDDPKRAAGVPGLRAVPDPAGAGARHGGALPAVRHHPAACAHRSARPRPGTYRGGTGAADRDVHDHADDRVHGRHRAWRRLVLRPGGAGAARA